MSTSKPVELGKVSEETKQNGPHPVDNLIFPNGEPVA
jgi:hypothetical protein